MRQRHSVKVTFENGDTIETEINGTEETVKDYYKIGKVFNLGFHYKDGKEVEDNMQAVTKLEFID